MFGTLELTSIGLICISTLYTASAETTNDPGYGSLLYGAAIAGDKKEAARLLEDGAEVDWQHSNGSTSLMAATEYNHANIAQVLVDAGASLDLQDRKGFDALTVAAQNDSASTTEVLIKAGADLNLQNKKGGSPLLISAKHGSNSVAKLLVNAGAKLNLENTKGYTALMVSAQFNSVEVAKTIIDAGGNLDINDNKKKMTTLMFCAGYGRLEILKMLLDAGAQINIQDHEGYTALHFAIYFNHPEEASLLIKKGIDFTMKNNHGKTGMDLASEKNLTNIIKMLKDAESKSSTTSTTTSTTTTTTARTTMKTTSTETNNRLSSTLNPSTSENQITSTVTTVKDSRYFQLPSSSTIKIPAEFNDDSESNKGASSLDIAVQDEKRKSRRNKNKRRKKDFNKTIQFITTTSPAASEMHSNANKLQIPHSNTVSVVILYLTIMLR